MLFDRLRTDAKLWDRYLNRSEYTRDRSDRSGRSLYSATSPFDISKPVVSDKLLSSGFNPIYPDNKDFALCLTHDIDIINYSGLRLPFHILKSLSRGQLKQAGRIALGQFSRSHNPLWNFEQIMELEKKYDAVSSFYFLALAKGEPDFQFEIQNCKDILIELDRSGWEVGLHGGHTAFDDPDQIRREKDRLQEALRKEVSGYRNHYLKFSLPHTWHHLQSAGFSHDSTIGYPDMIGFRNGMCHPYYPYDDLKGVSLDILEFPLVIMDATLEYYMKLDPKSAWEKIKALIDITKERRGVVTVLWHNNYMIEPWGELYEKILDYGQEHNGWLTSAANINRWYRKNNYYQTEIAK